jgi:feruloyl esterase
MRRLGDTTALLARLRRQTNALPTAVAGGETRMTETTGFGPNPGALRMLVYVPEGLDPGAPLVVVLHGCTQRAEAYAQAAGWLTLADRHGFVVLAPEQSQANNPNRCFNWFQPEDTACGRGEAASIAAMVDHAVREHRLDPERVFVTGLSAGGAMTSALLAAYPETFAAGAVVAGLPHGVADNLPEALQAMNGAPARCAAETGRRMHRNRRPGATLPRVSVWHGGADHTVRPDNAAAIARQWAAAHGLPAEPDETRTLPGRTRAVWRRPGTEEVLIECNLIDGLGHGAPLATGGPEGVGAAGPFMLEAGVSSSLEIARFWGIAEAADPVAAGRLSTLEPEVLEFEEQRGRVGVAGLGDQVMASLAGRVPADVQGVIEKALASAGLMERPERPTGTG